jgi:hypothetical protein
VDVAPLIPPPFRGPVLVDLPDGTVKQMSWKDAAKFHEALGQVLARGMRDRGSSPPSSGGDIGGTPVAMRMAA